MLRHLLYAATLLSLAVSTPVSADQAPPAAQPEDAGFVVIGAAPPPAATAPGAENADQPTAFVGMNGQVPVVFVPYAVYVFGRHAQPCPQPRGTRSAAQAPPPAAPVTDVGRFLNNGFRVPTDPPLRTWLSEPTACR